MKVGETARIAAGLISGERNDDYDTPIRNFQRISDIFFTLSGTKLKPSTIALLMVAVKMGRNVHKHKEDSIIDACGYLDIFNCLKAEETKNE